MLNVGLIDSGSCKPKRAGKDFSNVFLMHQIDVFFLKLMFDSIFYVINLT